MIFVNIGHNVDKYIPINRSPDTFLKSRNNFNFLIIFVTNEELIDIIKSLDSNKSSGPSSIPTKLLLIPDLIVFPLCKIINISFENGIFPEAIKLALYLRKVLLKMLIIIVQYLYYPSLTRLLKNLCIVDSTNFLRNTTFYMTFSMALERVNQLFIL